MLNILHPSLVWSAPVYIQDICIHSAADANILHF